MPQHSCKDCLFCEAVEDEDYMSCQVRQMLVMPLDKVCDLFEEKGCVCEECTMTHDINGYLNDLQDEYTNSTDKPCDCGCNCNDDYCNANSHPLDEESTQLDLLLDDFVTASDEVVDTLAFLGESTTTRDVLGTLLGLEATVAVLKRFLLEFEEK